MDDLANFNRQRWNNLVRAGIEYSRPLLDLNETTARQYLDRHGLLGEVRGRAVLCLANGGGQQSAAFAALGAQVVVIDLADEQLAQDRKVAAHYKVPMRIEQGDMRDLSRFAPKSFDIVWQVYSINFVPDPRQVFAQVNRVLRLGGLYRVDMANPFSMSVDEATWDGQGYRLPGEPYANGEVFFDDENWDVQGPDGTQQRIPGPREFRHTLSTFINGLVGEGFTLLGLWEENPGDETFPPGSWQHLRQVSPGWFQLWLRKKGT